jgi:hypothetical protein
MLDGSNAVFAGRVVEIERGTGVDEVSFRVSEVWKGPERETRALGASSQQSACGYSLPSWKGVPGRRHGQGVGRSE